MRYIKKLIWAFTIFSFILGYQFIYTSAEDETYSFYFQEGECSENSNLERCIYGNNNRMLNGNARMPLITGTDLHVSFHATGFNITMSTTVNETSRMIGVKNVLIQKKEAFGWRNVARSDGGYTRDTNMYLGNAVVHGLEHGTYRIIGTHYAYLSNGYNEVHNETNPFTF